ncbi:DUF1648 domain-containing protein (plasmid) [Rathayibacter sp. VKM Ac-2759]|uniref:DUF1648 domain-containing protein n=1 Tax=Rathayibacter sp. VKM Ac-2759 TaxID=2609252 RepID=UPI001317AD23|nr:DUF1648 domain-containing protein [Rathayibacter sp. VKM Ac-2759]QHC68867.1 DUF1648 domain-containing protein [Rathayibacter sp. VKM Ac-2759]
MTTTPALRTGTRLAVVAPGALVALTLGIAAIVLAPTLPSSIAMHFAADGRADGWGSPWPLLWIALSVTALAVVLAAVSLRSADRRTAATRLLVVNLIAAIFATGWIAIALTNTVGDGTLPIWWMALFLAVGAVSATIPMIALTRTAAPVPAHDAPHLEVPPTARVAWRTRAGSRWFIGLGVLIVALGIASAAWAAAEGAGSAMIPGIVLVVSGLAVLVLARVEVTVDIRGLRVTSSWTRIPIMRVPLARIESCGWEEVSPGQWGGWGYRVSGRGVAYVARSGPGLIARLSNGRARMVTVDDASRGAAVLQTLLAARHAA